MVTEALKGPLSLVGNQVLSVSVEEGLTVTLTGGTGRKLGTSDPAVVSGNAVAQRIKGTPGITG
jgi:urease alpha subunit